MQPTMSYDATADALAIDFARPPKGEHPVTRVLDPARPQVRGDFSASGQLLSIEILDATTLIPRKALDLIKPPVVMLTMAEAVKLSGRQPTTLKIMLARGRIPGAEKKGRDWQIPAAGLLNYLETLPPTGKPTTNKKAPRRRRSSASTG